MPFTLGKRYSGGTATITKGETGHFHTEEAKGKDGEDVK